MEPKETIETESMDPKLELRRKWTFRAHGRQMIFIKNMDTKPKASIPTSYML
jgi:hypothetical protein